MAYINHAFVSTKWVDILDTNHHRVSTSTTFCRSYSGNAVSFYGSCNSIFQLNQGRALTSVWLDRLGSDEVEVVFWFSQGLYGADCEHADSSDNVEIWIDYQFTSEKVETLSLNIEGVFTKVYKVSTNFDIFRIRFFQPICSGSFFDNWAIDHVKISLLFYKSFISCNPIGGWCSDTNKCTCNPGFHGELCQITWCDGILSNNSEVCNSHGECITPNNCSCSTGWINDYCNISTYSCNGAMAHNLTYVCSGHGECISNDICNCTTSWYGKMCQFNSKATRVYKFRENAEDLVGGQHGNVHSVQSFQPSNKCDGEYSAVFNGVDSSIEIPHIVPVSDRFAISIVLSVPKINFDQQEDVFYQVEVEFEIKFTPNSNEMVFNLGRIDDILSTHNWYGARFPTNLLKINEFFHFVGVFDGQNDKAKIYLNGALMDTVDFPSHTRYNLGTSFGPSYYPCIGCYSLWSMCKFFEGKIDEMRVYDYLTDEEVEEEYNNYLRYLERDCSGHGECISNDYCNCRTGWINDKCNISTYSCNDIMAHNFSYVCSGHGECVSNDTCDCTIGWYGGICQFNHVSNDINVYTIVIIVSIIVCVICAILLVLCVLCVNISFFGLVILGKKLKGKTLQLLERLVGNDVKEETDEIQKSILPNELDLIFPYSYSQKKNVEKIKEKKKNEEKREITKVMIELKEDVVIDIKGNKMKEKMKNEEKKEIMEKRELKVKEKNVNVDSWNLVTRCVINGKKGLITLGSEKIVTKDITITYESIININLIKGTKTDKFILFLDGNNSKSYVIELKKYITESFKNAVLSKLKLSNDEEESESSGEDSKDEKVNHLQVKIQKKIPEEENL